MLLKYPDDALNQKDEVLNVGHVMQLQTPVLEVKTF